MAALIEAPRRIDLSRSMLARPMVARPMLYQHNLQGTGPYGVNFGTLAFWGTLALGAYAGYKLWNKKPVLGALAGTGIATVPAMLVGIVAGGGV